MEIDERVLDALLHLGDVAATHDTVDWQTDKLGGIIDNWSWWGDPPTKPEIDRHQLNLLELYDALWDGMGTEDRIRLFYLGKKRFQNLRNWMGIE